MGSDLDAAPPDFVCARTGDESSRVALKGGWTLSASQRLELKAAQLVEETRSARTVIFDTREITRLDTAGALALNNAKAALAKAGAKVAIEAPHPEYGLLLAEMSPRPPAPPGPNRGGFAYEMLVDLGETVVFGLRDLYRGVGFLGELVHELAGAIAQPRKLRLTSLIYQMERMAFRSIPIIVLINLSVGAIVAQQGILQLMRFGAIPYAVDLIGILVLRELGVLITAIMVAGRSGSAITAELGSMVVREEIDALRAMGLSPIDVLVAPRILALTLSLPLLTIIADMSALFGGLLVSWVYGGISPPAFIALLREAVGLNTFYVGVIKAPFMALVVGLIAAQEGLSTKGSAELLGRQVTTSVVKSIFMVIILDGFFAIFFTAITY